MTPDEALKCATMLEAHPQSIMTKLATAKDVTEAQTFLDEIKKNARKKLRILAKDLHPDKTPDTTKHELLKSLLQIIEELEATTLDNFISRPQQPVMFVIVQVNTSTGYWVNNTTTDWYYR